MPENPEALNSAIIAGNGASIANSTDGATEAMRRQIQLHEQTEGNKTALDKLVELAWHGDGQTFSDLKSLAAQVGQSGDKAADPVASKIIAGQISEATRADQAAMATQNSVDYYAGNFLKAAPLFAGKSGLLMAASVGFNALDAVKMKDSGTQVVADLALGGAKGFAMKATFDTLLSPQTAAAGAEATALTRATAVAGAGLRGMEIGGVSRFYDSTFNRQTWVNNDGVVDIGSGISRTLGSTFDKGAIAMDAGIYMGAHGVFAGVAGLGAKALEASPTLQKLEASSLGSMIKDSKALPSAAMGATFGFSSGAVGEWSREKQSGESFDLAKIVKRGGLQALSDGAAGATGAAAARIPQERSTASSSSSLTGETGGLAFAGADSAVRIPIETKLDSTVFPRELPLAKMAVGREITQPREVSKKATDVPNLQLETFSLSDLTNIRHGDKPPTKEEWQKALGEGKFAVMLSGGGQQGYHHFGFLAALNEMGMRPLQITGVSAGSTFRALDLARDPSVKWDPANENDRAMLPGLIKALTPGSVDAIGRHQDTAADRANLKERIQALASDKSGVARLSQDPQLASFLSAAKQAVAGKHVMDEVFDTNPKGRPNIDLTDMAWNSAKPYRTILTGKDLGDGAVHGLPRVDLTELWWKNPFNIWRWALGAEVPAGIPHITTWDGSQLDMAPAFRALDKRLDLQNRNTPESSFLAYDIQNNRVVNFQGGQDRYDIATALTASTAINYDGKGVRPVDAIINGMPSKLVDLGVVEEGRYNSPTAHLPGDIPALVSQLPRPASPRRPNDMVVDFASGERPPFPLVEDDDVLQMFTHGYVETMHTLAPLRSDSQTTTVDQLPQPQSLALH